MIVTNYKIVSSDYARPDGVKKAVFLLETDMGCLLYTSPSPRDLSTSRMPSSA